MTGESVDFSFHQNRRVALTIWWTRAERARLGTVGSTSATGGHSGLLYWENWTDGRGLRQ